MKSLVTLTRFFDVDYTPILRRIILTIVESEGPIRLDGLARKVAQQHGWQRTGRRIQERVRKNLRSVESHSEFGTTFVWASRKPCQPRAISWTQRSRHP